VYYIQYGGDEVVKVKYGAGSAMLSMIWAVAEFQFHGIINKDLQLR